MLITFGSAGPYDTLQYHALPCIIDTGQNCAILCKTIQYHVVPSSTGHYQTITCNTMQYHAIPCSTMQYLVILCYTMRDLAIPCSTVQYTVLPCNTVPYNAIPSAALDCTGQCWAGLGVSSGFRKYSTLLVFQLLSWRLRLCLCMCNCLCLCICVPLPQMNSYCNELSEMYGFEGVCLSETDPFNL